MKSVEIKPLNDGCFLMETPRGDSFNCFDADCVGQYLEPAIWPLIEKGLKERKKVTIYVAVE